MLFIGSTPQVFEIVDTVGTENKTVLNYITLGGPIDIIFVGHDSPNGIF